MTLGQTSARLILAAAMLISVGCVSRNGRSRFAKSKDETVPIHNQAQLLAAARQYEKEGKTENATRYYRQVLALDPQNVDAKQGLLLVESGQLRTETGYDEIVSVDQPQQTPQLRSRDHLARRKVEIDEQTARLIANAAATAKQIKTESEPPHFVTIASSAPTIAEPTDSVTKALDSQSAARETLNVEVVAIVPNGLDISIANAETLSNDNIHKVPDASQWQLPTLTPLCKDANAAVLREVAKLDSDDPDLRKDGLRSLARMGADASSAAAPVQLLLKDDIEMVRAHAAWTLWEISGDSLSAVQPLTELLDSRDSDVVQYAVYTLSDIGTQARIAVPAVSRLLHSRDKLIRLHAAEALTQIAPDSDHAEAVETLIMLTAERSPQIRTLALVALGSVSEQPAIAITTALTSALHDSDAEVRAASALTLGGFTRASETTIAQLKFVAESDQEEVRQAAATALDCLSR